MLSLFTGGRDVEAAGLVIEWIVIDTESKSGNLAESTRTEIHTESQAEGKRFSIIAGELNVV